MNKTLFLLVMLLTSTGLFSQIKNFAPNDPIKASEINQNFSFIRNLFIQKNITIPFAPYVSGEVITKAKLESNFQLVRNLGVSVPALSSSPHVMSKDINDAFNSMLLGSQEYSAVPIANNSLFSIDEDSVLSGVVSFSNYAGNTLITITSPVSHGAFNLNPATGTFTYSPLAGYSGSDSFSFIVSDGISSSTQATVNINIAQVNDIPVIEPVALISTKVYTPVTTNLIGKDVELSPLTYIVTTSPTKGSLTINATGLLSYSPLDGESGIDFAIVKVNDGTSDSLPVTVNFNIIPSLDGDLVIASGDIQTISAGSTKEYGKVQIASGGTLNIVGGAGDISVLNILGPSEINGIINANAGSHTGGTFSKASPTGQISYSIVQASGGAGGAGESRTVAPSSSREPASGTNYTANSTYWQAGSGNNSYVYWNGVNLGRVGGGSSKSGVIGQWTYYRGPDVLVDAVYIRCRVYRAFSNPGSNEPGGISGIPSFGNGGGGGRAFMNSALNGGSATLNIAGIGAGQSNGASTFSEDGLSSSSASNAGGGGFRGLHGQGLYIKSKSLSGNGVINASGSIGGNGGNGGLYSGYGNGAGGGGAGGSGGKIWIRAKANTSNLIINIGSGAGGTKGSRPNAGAGDASDGQSGTNGEQDVTTY